MNQQTLASVIDRTRTPLDLKATPASIATTASSPGWVEVDFEMQHQCHSSWCWAAVAASVAGFYNESSTFTQCQIADLELHRNDCCSVDCHVDNVEFNKPHTLP